MSSKATARRLGQGALLCLLGLAALANDIPKTRWITVRWVQEEEVAGFKIYSRLVMQEYGEGRDIGMPEPVNGIYRYRLEVSNFDATEVSIRSYDANGVESNFSNKLLFLLPEK